MSGAAGPPTSQDAPQLFDAIIYRVGMNYCVDTPGRVSRAVGPAARVPVLGTVGGHEFSTNMIRRADGRYRVFLNAEVRVAAGAGEGDRVSVELRLDAEPREPPSPEDLRAALGRVDGGLEALRAMPPGMCRDALRSIESARRPETRARRVEQIVEIVLERVRR